MGPVFGVPDLYCNWACWAARGGNSIPNPPTQSKFQTQPANGSCRPFFIYSCNEVGIPKPITKWVGFKSSPFLLFDTSIQTKPANCVITYPPNVKPTCNLKVRTEPFNFRDNVQVHIFTPIDKWVAIGLAFEAAQCAQPDSMPPLVPYSPARKLGTCTPSPHFLQISLTNLFFSFPLIDVQGPPLKYLYQNLCLSLARKWNTNCESGNQPQVPPLMYQNSCWMSGLDKTTSYPILQSYLIKQK